MTRDEKKVLLYLKGDLIWDWKWNYGVNFDKALSRLMRKGYISNDRSHFAPNYGRNSYVTTYKGRRATKRFSRVPL